MSTEPDRGRPRLGSGYARLWAAGAVSNLGDGVALVAYPWLASAVTRNGMLLALIAVGQRLPWLVFSLPAGVLTDRLDRRRIMVVMDLVRFLLTAAVAAVVLARSDALPGSGEIAGLAALPTDAVLYGVLLTAATLLGFAEVLRDNAAQTILPRLVEPSSLETANGRIWGAEMVANSFAGPPLGSLLVGIGFALPFFFDAGTFAVAAGLVLLIPGSFRARRAAPPGAGASGPWWREAAEGVRWLWGHSLLRTLAVLLGIMNGLAMATLATFVFFAQELLGTSAFTFALVGTGGAIGGVLGTVLAGRVARSIGRGAALQLTVVTGGVTALVTGLASQWVIVWAMLALWLFTGTVWNVITVSLRQTIIPDHLLGRVNSVYRFFGWGMMPIGSAIGGLVVLTTEAFASRELALRMPWFATAAAYALVYVFAARRLTTPAIEAARAAATPEGPALERAGDA